MPARELTPTEIAIEEAEKAIIKIESMMGIPMEDVLGTLRDYLNLHYPEELAEAITKERAEMEAA